MALYYSNKNKLVKLFSSKTYFDESNIDERKKISEKLVEIYCKENNLNTNTIRKEILICIKLFLFKYYLEYESRLFSILDRNKTILGKKNVIIRKGAKRLFALKQAAEIVLPCKYSIGGFFFKLFEGLNFGFRKSKKKKTDILVLHVGTGKIEKSIWDQITGYTKREFVFRLFPSKMVININSFYEKNVIYEEFENDLTQIKGRIPFFLYSIIKLMVYSAHGFLSRNPSNIIVSFEQSSPHMAVLSYVCRKMNVVKIDLAHAVTFGENYKYSPSDYNLLFGKSSAQSFRKKESIVCGKIVEIGAPNLDRFFSVPEIHKPWNNDILFLPNYAIHERSYEQVLIMNTIEKLLIEFPEINLTVKHHPAKVNAEAVKILGKYSQVSFKKSADLLQEIDSHDLVIVVGWSVSGLEVTIRKRPLIRINNPFVPDWFGYSRSGYAKDASDYMELRNAYLQYKNSRSLDLGARKKIINYHLSNMGKAGEKIGSFLNSL